MPKKVKKPNPQDATHRNIRALKKKVAFMEAEVAKIPELERKLSALEETVAEQKRVLAGR